MGKQWGHSRDTVGTQWGHSGDTVGTQWGHSGDTVGTQCGHSRDTVGTQPLHTKRERESYIDYEKLGTSTVRVEEEWASFKYAFVGVSEELCGRTSGKWFPHQD